MGQSDRRDQEHYEEPDNESRFPPALSFHDIACLLGHDSTPFDNARPLRFFLDMRFRISEDDKDKKYCRYNVDFARYRAIRNFSAECGEVVGEESIGRNQYAG